MNTECGNGKAYQCFRDELQAQTTPGPLHFSYFQQAG